MGSLIFSLVHKWLKRGSRVYTRPQNSVFCFVASARSCTQRSANGIQPNFAKQKEVNGADGSRIRWRRIVNVNETIESRSEVFRGPNNHIKLAVPSRWVAFSGSTSLISTFSSFPAFFAVHC